MSSATMPATYSNVTADTELDGAASRQLWVSPVPVWTTAIPIWGRAWDFHVYFFASAFTVMTVVSFWLLIGSVMNRRRPARSLGKRRSRQQAKSLLPPPVLSLITFASFLRAFCLFMDPYHSTGRLPTALARVFGNLPFTSYVCAYQLLFLALHSALRVEVGTLRWLSKRWLIFSVVLFFMVFNTAVDLILVLAAKLRELLLICMVANSLWMAVIVFEFSYNSIRLKRRIDESRAALGPSPGSTLQAMAVSGLTAAITVSPKQAVSKDGRGFRHSLRKMTSRLTFSSTSSPKSDRIERTLRLQEHILRTTVLLLLTLLIYLGFLLYYVLGTANATPFESLVDPWTWYGVATTYRCTELLLSLSIIYMLTKSQQKKRLATEATDTGWTSRSGGRGSEANGGHANGTVSVQPPPPPPQQQNQRQEHTEVDGDRAPFSHASHALPAALVSFQRKTMLITAL